MNDIASQQRVRLVDYRPPDWFVDEIELRFELGFDGTLVHARLALRRNGSHAREVALDGEGLELLALRVDGRTLGADEYRLDERCLRFALDAAHATVETDVRIHPDANTTLEGLYRSGEFLVTQCEAEGFRHITFFPDRPDVMARYTVTLVASREQFPVLLSNGNAGGSGTLADGRHWARWIDPFPKPSYLFALVAGRLALLADTFRTADGRDVALHVWAEADAISRCAHAMDCVKRAMRWDEQAFGRIYDLEVFNIVATHDFNMGAMENKGLNVFNSKYIVADIDTATDDDFAHIEGVIAHEYFHNWTGNRVTCRDWFQLALKEGLTVFRDQEFSADMSSRALKRIEDVRMLKGVQFAEDAGPFAHAVRPDTYLEINNFYTATVYEKGAEVVRMMHTVLGAERFRRGMDLYFARHDGQAVTCDDFRVALAEGSGVDLSRFARWYTQAGTPQLRASSRHDAARGEYQLTLAQATPPTPGQPDKAAVPIPVRVMLYAADGAPLPLALAGEAGEAPSQRVLLLDSDEQGFTFTGIAEEPVASLLQGFSAPVQLHRESSPAELAFLARHDRDAFNCWEAFQRLGEHAVLSGLHRPETIVESGWFVALADAAARLLRDDDADPGLIAECLILPDEAYLAERTDSYDPHALHVAREAVRAGLGSALSEALARRHEELSRDDARSRDGAAMTRRRLKNIALALLVLADPARHAQRAHAQLETAGNMTDRLAALTALAHTGVAGAQGLAEKFYQRWRHDPLVVDKWLALQASNPETGTLERVLRLTEHPAFTWRNPNKVRSLIGAFARNRIAFHAVDGTGYRFLGEAVMTMDRLNPQIAARLVSNFNAWRRLEPLRRSLMRTELQRLDTAPGLSPDVGEIVARALA